MSSVLQSLVLFDFVANKMKVTEQSAIPGVQFVFSAACKRKFSIRFQFSCWAVLGTESIEAQSNLLA